MKRSQWTFNVAVDFWRGKKAVMAGRDGRDLYLAGLGWSTEERTDGFIPTEAMSQLAGYVEITRSAANKAATRLVDVSMWEVVQGGWIIHDFSDWQYTAAEREKQQSAAEKRREKWRRDASRDASTDASTDADATGSSVISQKGLSFSEYINRPVSARDDDDDAFIDEALVLVVAARFDYADQRGKVKRTDDEGRERYRATCERNARTDPGLRERVRKAHADHPEWPASHVADIVENFADVLQLRPEPPATCRWCHAFLSKHHAENDCSRKPFEEAQS